ncbi:MAG: hypothetical protein VCA37_03075 [Roseibacillus sp.]
MVAGGRSGRYLAGRPEGLEGHLPALLACAIGGALLVGGVAGIYGDRLWIKRGVLDNPQAPVHPIAKVISKVLIGAGLVAIPIGLVLYFNR